jgi:hypothetical protein
MTKRKNKHYPAEFKQEAVAPLIDQDYPIEQAAAQELTQLVPDTQYFPAFEIVTGPQAPESYFQDDRREPSSQAIDMVMATLQASVMFRLTNTKTLISDSHTKNQLI